MIERSRSGVVVGNVYDKYGTGNPLARALMDRFLRTASDLVARSRVPAGGRVLEVGAGEGHLLAHLRPLKPGASFVGLELSPELVAQATVDHGDVRTSFVAGSAYALPFPDASADLVLCCETLEHLDDPDTALLELRRVLRPGGRALLSVPREPLWRTLNVLRGKYLAALGNTPGHVGHYSPPAFARLVERSGLRVLERRTPLPWTLLLAERTA